MRAFTIDRVTLGEEERVFSKQHQATVDGPQQHLTASRGQTLKQKPWRRRRSRNYLVNKYYL